MKHSILIAASLTAIALASTGAHAQPTDVVIMRKTMTARPAGTPGTGTPTTSGTTPAPSPTPVPSKGSWTVGEWTDASSDSCTATAIQRRTVTCQVDGAVVDASRCEGSAPASQRTIERYDGCQFRWVEGAWTGYSSTCSATASRTRDVSCFRSDGTKVADASCDPAARPAAQERVPVYEGCSHSWKTGDFLDPGPSCTTAETQTRTVVCQRDLDGTPATDAACAPQPRPNSSTVVEDFSACGYEAADWSPYVWSSTCSATAIRTRTAQCRRSDGTKVPDVECTVRGIELSQSETAENYSSCTYEWNAQAWSAPSTTCGQAQFTRTVTCRSLPDGRTVDDGSCDASKRPDASKTEEVVGGCGYGWKTGDWGANAPACGSSVQTRSVTCQRSDGSTASDGMCASAGPRPTDHQATTDYSTCTYGWSATGWTDWSNTCGSASRSRTVTCQSSDGRTVPDQQCSGTRPEESQSDYLTTGCGYAFQHGEWGAPEKACGASRQWRAVWCLRSDGKVVDDASCGSERPTDNQAATDYSACSYSWSTGTWSAPSTTCGAATQYRSVSCVRSDGTVVDDAQCASAGAKPAEGQSTYQTDGCSYHWRATDWGTPVGACGSTTQSRSVYCQREDGVTAEDWHCDANRPHESQTTTDYSTCSYEYTTSEWTDWSSTCSSDAFRRRTVYCQRSDGFRTNTDYTQCQSAGKIYPGYEERSAIYSSCSYSPTYGAWEKCEFLGTRRRPVTCTRSDGTKVDATYCGAQTADFEYGTCEVQGEARGTTTSAHAGDEILRSPNGQYRLVLQPSGDLTILNGSGQVTWHTNTSASDVLWVFQGDGNMVLYRNNAAAGAADAVWSSDTWANTRAYYVLDDVGQLTIYNQDREPSLIFRSQGGTSSYFSPTRR